MIEHPKHGKLLSPVAWNLAFMSINSAKIAQLLLKDALLQPLEQSGSIFQLLQQDVGAVVGSI